MKWRSGNGWSSTWSGKCFAIGLAIPRCINSAAGIKRAGLNERRASSRCFDDFGIVYRGVPIVSDGGRWMQEKYVGSDMNAHEPAKLFFIPQATREQALMSNH